MSKNHIIICLLITASLVMLGCSSPTIKSSRVYGRFVPERKDDFAWENEFAAFRMYGPALANENPSNGVDLWLKKSPELIVDSFYYRESQLGLPYHINYGKGLDCYKVGHTVGCGGLAIMVDDSVYIGGPYSSWEILTQTPDTFRFALHYDSVLVAGNILQEDIIITCMASQPMNEAKVVLYTKNDSEINNLFLGGGIYLHDSIDHLFMPEKQTDWIGYAENSMSDKTAAQMNFDYNGSTDMGRNYIVVHTPGATIRKLMDGNAVCLAKYTLGDTLTYYFGACWSQWSDAEKSFTSEDEFFDFIVE